MKRILLASLVGISTIYAQQGDRGKVQIDPIPADQIPPSPYLGIEDSMKAFEVADGFQLEPIAHGDMVRMPVAMDFDTDGRAWVVEMRNYMPDLDGNNEHRSSISGRVRSIQRPR